MSLIRQLLMVVRDVDMDSDGLMGDEDVMAGLSCMPEYVTVQSHHTTYHSFCAIVVIVCCIADVVAAN